MISVRQCLEFSGLTFNDLVIGTSTSEKHRGLLESYLLNIDRGASTVRKMIVADLRAFLDLGLLASAADAFIVLRAVPVGLSRGPADVGWDAIE